MSAAGEPEVGLQWGLTTLEILPVLQRKSRQGVRAFNVELATYICSVILDSAVVNSEFLTNLLA